MVIDLTPVRDGTGPARLLDMVEGRSKQAFKTWLADRPQADWLSAGMSGDLEEAVKAGATHVRVGSAILGPRPSLL